MYSTLATAEIFILAQSITQCVHTISISFLDQDLVT